MEFPVISNDQMETFLQEAKLTREILVDILKETGASAFEYSAVEIAQAIVDSQRPSKYTPGRYKPRKFGECGQAMLRLVAEWKPWEWEIVDEQPGDSAEQAATGAA